LFKQKLPKLQFNAIIFKIKTMLSCTVAELLT